MTGGAGRGRKVLAHGPRDFLEVPVPLPSGEDIAVLAGRVHLEGRDIRPDMALLAGVRLAGHFDRKSVPGMAGRTGAHTAVQIYAPHALIGPTFDDGKFQLTGGFGIPGFIPVELEFGAVAVIAGFGLGGIIGRRYF